MINYWEVPVGSLGPRLDGLLKQGIQQIGTFVPWQIVESDISHSVTRFLHACSERHIRVFLMVSPELGLHAMNSGLPKDLIVSQENRAKSVKQDPISVFLPPRAFTLPSLFAPEFNKRYSSFLARMDSLFADLNKNQPSLMRDVTVVLSGSFWKYYRSSFSSSASAFGDCAGDYSIHAASAYRQQMDQFFSQTEFMEPTPAAAQQWKTRSLEEVNRRWFYQQAEDVFRNRSFQMIRKKSNQLDLLQMEIFVPEADPSLFYSQFLQAVSGGNADFSQLSRLLDEISARSVWGVASSSPLYFHWTSMGGFRFLSEPEKQFLILKSLLLSGAQKGGVILDESEWLSFSKSFRARTEALVQAFHAGDLRGRSQALYWTPHLWSRGGLFWTELARRMGSRAKMLSSLDLLLLEKSAKLLIVDTHTIMTQGVVQKLIAWAQSGKVVVLPKSSLYTEAAKRELEKSLKSADQMEMDFGVHYQLYALKTGKVIVYEIPQGASESLHENIWKKAEPFVADQGFVGALLAIADLEGGCSLSESRLSFVLLETSQKAQALFVMNGTSQQVSADLVFSKEVRVSDLRTALARDSSSRLAHYPHLLTQKLPLDVPPYGILPLAVEGLQLLEQHDSQLDAAWVETPSQGAAVPMRAELPGYHPEQSWEELWS